MMPDEHAWLLALRAAAHDVNNPLTAVRLLAELASSEASLASVRADLDQIARSADLAGMMIEALQGEVRRRQWVASREPTPIDRVAPFDLAVRVRRACERPAAMKLRVEGGETWVAGDTAAVGSAVTDILLLLVRLGAEDARVQVYDDGRVGRAWFARGLPVHAGVLDPSLALIARSANSATPPFGLAHAVAVIDACGGALTLPSEGGVLVCLPRVDVAPSRW